MTILLLFLLGIIGFCKAALPLPSYIEPCALSDPNFKQCVVDHARKTIPHIVFTGDKKYRVPVLEPLEVTEIRIDQGASQVGLSLIIRNAKIYGIKDMHVEDVGIDFENSQLHSELHIPNIVILGKYNASGKILLLPVYGDGDINITLNIVSCAIGYADFSGNRGGVNVLSFSIYDVNPTTATSADAVAKLSVDFKKVTKKDGLEYIETYNPRGTLDVSRMYAKVDNLFNGDKLLGEQMNAVLNDNWKEVFHDMEPAIKQTVVTVMNSILTGFIGLVPFDDIFPSKIP